MKARTIDQHCKCEAGGFKKFIKKKQDFLKSVEENRKERIRASRKGTRELAWAS